jgi:hypothetical protein
MYFAGKGAGGRPKAKNHHGQYANSVEKASKGRFCFENI